LAGKLQWLHTTSSLAFTFYRAGEKRGAIPQDLQGGVVVHDHFLPYRRLDTCTVIIIPIIYARRRPPLAIDGTGLSPTRFAALPAATRTRTSNQTVMSGPPAPDDPEESST
jgi:hypothetical protein